MLLPDPPLESTDLLLLKHIWKISPADGRQVLLKLLSDNHASDESDPEMKQLASLRRTWLRLTDAERDAWRKFVTAESAAGQ